MTNVFSIFFPDLKIEHTSYCGAPDHELHCNPIENAEWREITARKQREREQSASFVTHAGHQLALHNASLGIGDREMLGKGDFIVSSLSALAFMVLLLT